MENVAQLGYKIREQSANFLGTLPTLPKPTNDFVNESVLGIIARQSVRLTEIGRFLHEDIGLAQTEKRLSRQIAQEGIHEAVTNHIVKSSAHRIKEETLLVLDPSDITKKYAKAMEYQAHVRDGSASGHGTVIGNGYWMCSIIGVECDGLEITPLYNGLWSQKSPDFKSENDEITKCIDSVAQHLDGRGIWVIDRGGDRSRYYELLLDRNLKFIVRLIGNRHLIYKGKALLAEDIAQRCPLPYAETIVKKNKEGAEVVYNLQFGVCNVMLKNYRNKNLKLVVVKGYGEKPMMLLTTECVKKSYKSVRWILRSYLTRWRIEDTIRFAKQSYKLEDIRLLKYRRLQNMMALVLAAMSFTMTHLGTENKLKILCNHALTAAQRLFGIPDFMYYALADGLRELLSRLNTPFKSPPREKLPNYQLQLDLTFSP